MAMTDADLVRFLDAQCSFYDQVTRSSLKDENEPTGCGSSFPNYWAWAIALWLNDMPSAI
jgi:hypothetical protein